MSGPWEKYAAQPTPTGTPPPWEKYATLPDAPNIVQEMHPDFGVGERLLLKNFANSPEAGAAYLKKKHPEMDIQVHQGQIIGKKPGEAEYRALDPDPSFFSTQFIKDLPLDVADVGTDAVQGVASGMAAGVAGAAGAAATLPSGGWGALPAAATAGGATNAALEASKQKLGAYFGIPQEVSGKQVAIAGLAGAASPLLFGTGASAGQLAKQGANLTPEAIEILKNAQRGGVPRAWDWTKGKVLPAAAEAVSGAPAEAVKAYAKNPSQISQLKDAGVTDYVDEVHGQLRQGIASAKTQIGRRLESEIDNAGGTVNLEKTKNIIDTHIKNLESSELKDNPLVKQQLAELKTARDELLTEVKDTTHQEPVLHTSSVLGPDGKPVVRQVGVKDVVTQTKSEIPNEVSAKKAFELQALLNDQAEVTKMGQGLQSRFGKNAQGAEKAWAEANRKASSAINDELETATEGMSSKLKGDYREYAQLQRDLQARFRDPEATFKTLSNIHGKGKEMLKERLERVSELTGGQVKPMEAANTLSAFKYFATPSKVPLSSGGTTSTSRTGILGLLGYGIGHKLGGPLGGLQGAGAANFLGSPAGIKAYTLGGQAVGRGFDKVMSYAPNAAMPAAPLSIWEMLKSQEPLEEAPYGQPANN